MPTVFETLKGELFYTHQVCSCSLHSCKRTESVYVWAWRRLSGCMGVWGGCVCVCVCVCVGFLCLCWFFSFVVARACVCLLIRRLKKPLTHARFVSQFSVTDHYEVSEYQKAHYKLPGVFFQYDFAPLRIKYKENKKSIRAFLTRICAVVGGSFVVLGILASLWDRAVSLLFGKESQAKIGGPLL